MRINIIDENHFMLMASESEMDEYSNYTRILIDNKDTFICNSEPSSTAFVIERPEEGTLFNEVLDISYSPFTTNELLIVFLEMDDLTYPWVIPCYDNLKLMNLIAKKTGIIDNDDICECKENLNKVYPIILYYGFKMALSIFDIKTAIRYWERLLGQSNSLSSKCGCHG